MAQTPRFYLVTEFKLSVQIHGINSGSMTISIHQLIGHQNQDLNR